MSVSVPEQYCNEGEQIRRGIEYYLNNTRVCIPGIIKFFNAKNQTAVVQPAIKELLLKKWEKLPPLMDVPAFFPRAGGYCLTFPVKPEDECLLIFADMCLDAWWQSGDVQTQLEMRRHDLSDACALLGITSVPRAVTEYSTNSLMLRNEDKDAYFEIVDNTKVINIKTVGDINVESARNINVDAARNIKVAAVQNIKITADARLQISSTEAMRISSLKKITMVAPKIYLNPDDDEGDDGFILLDDELIDFDDDELTPLNPYEPAVKSFASTGDAAIDFALQYYDPTADYDIENAKLYFSSIYKKDEKFYYGEPVDISGMTGEEIKAVADAQANDSTLGIFCAQVTNYPFFYWDGRNIYEVDITGRITYNYPKDEGNISAGYNTLYVGRVEEFQGSLDNEKTPCKNIVEFKTRYGELIENYGQELGIDPNVLGAIFYVESSGGGFYDNGKLKIRFEDHIFLNSWAGTNGKYSEYFIHSSSDYSQEAFLLDGVWINTHSNQPVTEYQAFVLAKSLDETAAYNAISMGFGQQMGFNHSACGYLSAKDMFDDYSRSERQQIVGTMNFIVNYNKGVCLSAIKNNDFDTFGLEYNNSSSYGREIQDSIDEYKKAK